MITQDKKQAIRQKLRKARAKISPNEHAILSKTACQHLIDSSLLDSTNNIGVYLAHGSELDLSHLIEWLWQQKTRLYIPCTKDHPPHHFHFCHYAPQTVLTLNRWGINEPTDPVNTFDANELDILCLPLVGFTSEGQRLGQGGGHYDRMLADTTSANRPLCIGMAFDCQRENQLPRENWDIDLDQIVTESGKQNE